LSLIDVTLFGSAAWIIGVGNSLAAATLPSCCLGIRFSPDKFAEQTS